MKKSISTIVIILISFLFLYDYSYAATKVITSPVEGETIYTGSTIEIKWDPKLIKTDSVFFYLLNEDNYIWALSPDGGSYVDKETKSFSKTEILKYPSWRSYYMFPNTGSAVIKLDEKDFYPENWKNFYNQKVRLLIRDDNVVLKDLIKDLKNGNNPDYEIKFSFLSKPPKSTSSIDNPSGKILLQPVEGETIYTGSTIELKWDPKLIKTDTDRVLFFLINEDGLIWVLNSGGGNPIRKSHFDSYQTEINDRSRPTFYKHSNTGSLVIKLEEKKHSFPQFESMWLDFQNKKVRLLIRDENVVLKDLVKDKNLGFEVKFSLSNKPPKPNRAPLESLPGINCYASNRDGNLISEASENEVITFYARINGGYDEKGNYLLPSQTINHQFDWISQETVNTIYNEYNKIGPYERAVHFYRYFNSSGNASRLQVFGKTYIPDVVYPYKVYPVSVSALCPVVSEKVNPTSIIPTTPPITTTIPCFNYTRDLVRDSSGDDVSALQKFLAYKGYVNPVTGYYGGITEANMSLYQKSINLPMTGKLDNATRRQINNLCGHATPVTPVIQPPAIQTLTPRISSISPSSARYGNTITIYGSNLGNTINQVSLRNPSGGEVNPTITYRTSTSITFKLPNIPYDTYDVNVFDDNEGDSNSIKLTVLAPVAVNVLPQTVTIHRPFESETSTIGNIADITWSTMGTVNMATDLFTIELYDSTLDKNTKIIIKSGLSPQTSSYKWAVPRELKPGSYFIRVSSQNTTAGSGFSKKFNVVNPQVSTPTLSLSSISQSSARYGDTVTIYGSNLGNIKDLQQIQIRNSRGGEAYPTSISSRTSTSITFKLPNIPYDTYDVNVFDYDIGDSNAVKLTILAPIQSTVTTPVYTTPYITKTSPTIVKAGDTVTLEGVNFEGVDSSLVFIRNNTGGEITPEVLSISNTKITFKTPNISYGTYSVSLLGDKGDSNTVTITIGSTSGASAISVWGWLEKMFR